MPRIISPSERSPVTSLGVLEEFRRLERAIPTLVSGRPLEQVLQGLVESAAAAAGTRWGSIFLLDPEDQHLYPAVTVRLPEEYERACQRIPLGAGACGHTAQTRKPCVVADTSTDPLFASFREVALRSGIRALFSVPVIANDGRMLGALANHFPQPHTPAPEDIERNLLYAHLAAAAIEMARAMKETAARAAAEAELRMRERFIGILSHDLRTPLGAIAAGTAHLLEQGGLPASQVRIVSRIAASASRMARMVEQLMDVTRDRLGQGIPVEPRPTDLHRICRQVVEEVHAARPGSTIRLHTTGSGRGTWDPERLTQALANLVGNAVEHGSPDHPVVIGIDGCGDRVLLEVTNQGPPIPPEMLPHLFEPFRGQVRQSGLGLGLYITRAIVHAHGGRIEVHSAGPRTTFRVTLPRTAAAKR